jgi:hypothetical protein
MKQIVIVIAVIAASIGIWYWYTRPQPVVAPRLAPPGVYFLVQHVSVTTVAGVIGFPEGTRVKLVREEGDKMRVTDGTTEIDVEKRKVTNDLDVAGAAARRDAASLRKFEAWTRQQKNALAKQRQQEAEDVERAERLRRQRALPPIGTTPNPLDRPAYNPH